METKHHTKLTARERDLIAVWRGARVSIREISRRLGRSHSTIIDELNRNRWGEHYVAIHAQQLSDKRKREARKRHPLKNPDLCSYVVAKLEKGWSPETVAGRLRKHNGRSIICHETIYQFVYLSDYGKQQKLYQYLKRGKKHRTKYYGRRSQKEIIPNRVFINERPENVAQRTDIGHWEGDSIIYANKQAINSLVERKSRFTVLTKLERKTALLTQQAVSRLTSLPHKTLTVDNGTENTNHEHITRSLGIKVYFCHPYHSWEKGTNENTNGLVRRYLPRGTSLQNVTQEDIDDIAWELNNRPRKVLNFSTPQEILESELGGRIQTRM